MLHFEYKHLFVNYTEDIFGDMEEDKEDEDGSSRSKRMKVDESSVSTELNWYYKTEGVTHGPLSSSEMFKMQTERYFAMSIRILSLLTTNPVILVLF